MVQRCGDVEWNVSEVQDRTWPQCLALCPRKVKCSTQGGGREWSWRDGGAEAEVFRNENVYDGKNT